MQSKKICIIGAGIAGCTTACCLAEQGYIVTIFEKQSVIGGNCYDYYDKWGVLVHKYGPHIFHTNYDDVWNFVNRFGHFNNYINQVLVNVNNDSELVPFPINLVSIKKIFPDLFNTFLDDIKKANLLNKTISIAELLDLIKSAASHKILQYIYQNIYANYTAKMWGCDIKEVDLNVIKRVKINLNEVWNYFPDDKYCGIPIDGYTNLLSKMITHPNITLKLNASPVFEFKNSVVLVDCKEYDKVIYTGSLDSLLEYKFGDLAYRSIKLVFKHFDKAFFQIAPIINYPSHETLTRICEYKYLTGQKIDSTSISYEYPGMYNRHAKEWNIPFYPINNENNIRQYKLYVKHLKQYKNLVVCGRLAEYKYYDMDDIIYVCFDVVKKICNQFR